MAAPEDRIWYFDVSDPTNHPKGFTIYKVTAKVFPIKAPEKITEVVAWKRYNDFKHLFKAMCNLHKSLHRREEFPEFAKPKLFGRFDGAVIEERRISALNLLNFIGRQSHLYKSQLFAKFLESGKVVEGLSGKVIPTSGIEFLSSTVSKSGEPILKPNAGPGKLEPASDKQDSAEETSQNDGPKLEGVWNFPQVPDNISINSDEDTDATDVDSTLGTPLPDSDISFFDPLADKQSETEAGQIHTSKSWIMEAVNTCAGLIRYHNDTYGILPYYADTGGQNTRVLWEKTISNKTEGGVRYGLLTQYKCSDRKYVQKLENEMTTANWDKVKGDPELDSGGLQMKFDEDNESMTDSDTLTQSTRSGQSTSIPDVTEFDPLSQRVDSADANVNELKGDMDNQKSKPSMSIGSSSSLDSNTGVGSSPRKLLVNKLSPRRRSGTKDSVSTMDLGSKEDYIYMAANQICIAQEHEANNQYDLAFATYKTCVGILLQGVQGDNNKGRRDAVRRKTAQYLMKAEELYNKHLAKEATDEQRWAMDSLLSPSTEVDPALTFIRGSVSDLKKFKVLGTIDKVILVLDKTTEETFIIKRIYKSPTGSRDKPNILPTSCPYMVSLHKFYEAHGTVYLLLQYASGGRLWDYVGAYLQYAQNQGKDQGMAGDYPKQQLQNVYTGYVIHQDDNKISPSDIKSTPPTQSNISPGSNTQVMFSKQTDDVTIGSKTDKEYKDLDVNDFQFSMPPSKSIEEEIHKVDTSLKQSDKVTYNRYTSFDSEDNIEVDPDISMTSPAGIERQSSYSSTGGKFEEVLQKNKSALENFSINSFDSFEGVPRVDSNVSDHIEVIHEVNEQVCDTEVFSEPNNIPLGGDTTNGVLDTLVGDNMHSLHDTQGVDSIHDVLEGQSAQHVQDKEGDGVMYSLFDIQGEDRVHNIHDTQGGDATLSIPDIQGEDRIHTIYDTQGGGILHDTQGGDTTHSVPDIQGEDRIHNIHDKQGDDITICGGTLTRISVTDPGHSTTTNGGFKPLPSDTETNTDQRTSIEDDIISNSKALLRTVERTLSVVDGDPQSVADSEPTDTGPSGDSDFTETCTSVDITEDSCDTFTEPSIYDLNHYSDTSDSQSDTRSRDLDPMTVDQNSNNSVGVSNPTGIPSQEINNQDELPNGLVSDRTRSESGSSDVRSRTSTDATKVPRKLSLSRVNSTDLSRSASSDYEFKSPSKARQSKISHMFEQLDLSMVNPDQVKIPESFIRRWAAEIIIALSRLHALGIVCRELKPANILLGDQGHATLTYFCQINQVSDQLDFEAIQNLYVAPEVKTISGYTEVCDWWSLGALLYELLVGKSLLVCHPGGITSHTQLFVPEHVSEEARALLTELLRYNPKERLGSGMDGVEEIKVHPFFAGIDWNGMEM